MAQRKADILKAALMALAGGALVALFNPAEAIERKADHGMAAIDHAALTAVAVVERQPSPAPRTAASNTQ